LTPGDIVVLQRGDPVPADCQLIQCDNLRIQEAALTGESAPVDKTPSPFDASGPPTSDRRVMAFMGTVVVAGHGLGVVTATGARTQWGRIAALTQTVQRKRQPRPHAEERQIVAVVLLIIIGVLLILGILHGVLSMTIAALVAAGAIVLPFLLESGITSLPMLVLEADSQVIEATTRFLTTDPSIAF
jgi:Ca2+-transporting ATPase